MAKWGVSVVVTMGFYFEVEADTEAEAKEIAKKRSKEVYLNSEGTFSMPPGTWFSWTGAGESCWDGCSIIEL